MSVSIQLSVFVTNEQPATLTLKAQSSKSDHYDELVLLSLQRHLYVLILMVQREKAFSSL